MPDSSMPVLPEKADKMVCIDYSLLGLQYIYIMRRQAD